LRFIGFAGDQIFGCLSLGATTVPANISWPKIGGYFGLVIWLEEWRGNQDSKDASLRPSSLAKDHLTDNARTADCSAADSNRLSIDSLGRNAARRRDVDRILLTVKE